MRTRAWVCTVGLLVVGLVVSTPAAADDVLLSRFEPSDRGSRFFFADSLELGRRDVSDPRSLVAAGVTSSYANTLTTWGDHSEGKRATLVKDAFWVHPGASVTIHPGVRFALDVPIAAYQFGEDTNLSGGRYFAPSSPRLGDIRPSFEIALLGPTTSDADGFALSGGVTGWLPTGSADDYAGDDFARFGIHASGRWRRSWLLAAARVGYMYRRDGYVGGSRVGPEVNATAGVAWTGDRWTVGPELVASSAIDAELAKRATPVEILLGAHADLGGGLRGGGGIGTALVKGMGAADVQAVLSLEWLGPGASERRDRDRDGVPDRDDLCPDLPGTAAGSGCPNAPMLPEPEVVPPPPVEPGPPPVSPPPAPPAAPPGDEKSETPGTP